MNLKFLLCDDERGTHAVLRALVSSSDAYAFCKLDSAYSIREGLEKLKSFVPEVVLLDLHFLGESTVEQSMEAIKEFKRHAAVVILTGNATHERWTQCIKNGAFGFLDKNDVLMGHSSEPGSLQVAAGEMFRCCVTARMLWEEYHDRQK